MAKLHRPVAELIQKNQQGLMNLLFFSTHSDFVHRAVTAQGLRSVGKGFYRGDADGYAAEI